jgi:hypothetical protein
VDNEQIQILICPKASRLFGVADTELFIGYTIGVEQKPEVQ